MWSICALGLVQTLVAFCSLAADAQTLVKGDDGTGIHIYYHTSWSAPNIHFTKDHATWTAFPGVKMSANTDSTQFPNADGWFRYDVPAPATFLEFAFNDGSTWDGNGGNNYNVQTAGTYSLVSAVAPPPADNCNNFDGPDYCTSSTQSTLPDSTNARKWQTPPRNTLGWSDEFQDYRSLTGYAHVAYNAARTSATVEVRTFLREAATCSYSFNGAWTSSPSFNVDSSLRDELVIAVVCTPNSNSGTDWILGLDGLHFVWQSNAVNQPAAMEVGQKGAIVDLFGWSYEDIEAECKHFLGKAGYMGMKINPPQEFVLSDRWMQYGQRNPDGWCTSP